MYLPFGAIPRTDLREDTHLHPVPNSIIPFTNKLISLTRTSSLRMLSNILVRGSLVFRKL